MDISSWPQTCIRLSCVFLCVCVWEWHLTHYKQSANPLKVYNADGCHLRNQIWDLLKSISAKEKIFVLALLLNRSSQKRQIKYPLLSNCCLSFFVTVQVHITTKAVLLSSLGTQQTLENYLKCCVLASSALTVKSAQSPFRKCFFFLLLFRTKFDKTKNFSKSKKRLGFGFG